MASPAASEVYIIDASDRSHAVRALWREIGPLPLDGKTVSVKANFNSDDPFPATTHPDMLEAILGQVRDAGAGSIALSASEAGMGTARVLKNRGPPDVAARVGGGDGARLCFLRRMEAIRWTASLERGGRTALPGGRCGGPDLLPEDAPVRRPCLPLPEKHGRGGGGRNRGRLQLHDRACIRRRTRGGWSPRSTGSASATPSWTRRRGSRPGS